MGVRGLMVQASVVSWSESASGWRAILTLVTPSIFGSCSLGNCRFNHRERHASRPDWLDVHPWIAHAMLKLPQIRRLGLLALAHNQDAVLRLSGRTAPLERPIVVPASHCDGSSPPLSLFGLVTSAPRNGTAP